MHRVGSGSVSRRLPVPDEDSTPFWQGCAEGQLRFQWCLSCGELNWFPRRMCRKCSSDALEWRAAPGTGCVYSFSIVHRPPSPEFPSSYALALIDVASGPRMMSHVRSSDLAGVRVGCDVAVEFEWLSDEIALPVFRLVE